MADSAWVSPRCDKALALQWARRVGNPLPFILEEVNQRMVSRAQIMRPAEGDVMVQGWLHPDLLPAVQSLFVDRQVWAIQPIASPALASDQHAGQAGRSLQSLFRKVFASDPPGRAISWKGSVVQPGGVLDAAAESIGMVWSPLWLHAVSDPARLLAEWFRVLRFQGAVFFTAWGPDTAVELKQACHALGLEFPDFMDMHDLGDLVSRVGFSDPVMEMEKITLTYGDLSRLLAEWRQVGGNSLVNRGKGLRGKGYLQALERGLGVARKESGGDRATLTLEIVYGHAWKVRPKSTATEAFVPVSSIQRSKG